MNRRDLVRSLSAAGALSLLPGQAEAVWARVLSGPLPAAGLSDAQLELVAAIADVILPPTDSPGATDVGVPDFVNVIVAEYYSEVDRTAFVNGLDAIDAQVRRTEAAAFADLNASARNRMLTALDQPADRQAAEARTFSRLKGLVIHGYFTSERVQKDVLKVQVMPGRFDGAAPHVVRGAP